jgi:predicted Fe-Mo cluster-binding NifX family protein/ferredoxin
MKIAITSTGPTLDDNVEARFGRCPYFLIIDTDTMQYEAIENPNIALGGGAGIQSAQLMSEKEVKTILTGNCGPNAFNVFGQAGIQVIVGVSGHVRNTVKQFKAGTMTSATGPNVDSHFGTGSGRGIGCGGGMGKGMGRGTGKRCGGGMGQSMNMSSTGYTVGLPKNAESQDTDHESATLKRQAEMFELQKQQLNQRISQLENGRKTTASVNLQKCIGCGLCADVCPVGAIKVNEHAVVNDSVCTCCGACVSACPNKAIEITQK